MTVSGSTLRIYLSAPANLSGDPQAHDVIDAELLAFNPSCTLNSCAPIHVGGFTVNLVRLTGDKLSSNARRAAGNRLVHCFSKCLSWRHVSLKSLNTLVTSG